MDVKGELAGSSAEVLPQARFFFLLARLSSIRPRASSKLGRSLRILCTELRSRAAAAPGRSGRSPEGDFSIRIVS